MVNNRMCRNMQSANRRTTQINSAGCAALGRRLKQVEFALADVILYLDAYPECERALEYYHELLSVRSELLNGINTQCGPMTALDNTSTSAWQWIDGPWPWQPDAN